MVTVLRTDRRGARQENGHYEVRPRMEKKAMSEMLECIGMDHCFICPRAGSQLGEEII